MDDSEHLLPPRHRPQVSILSLLDETVRGHHNPTVSPATHDVRPSPAALGPAQATHVDDDRPPPKAPPSEKPPSYLKVAAPMVRYSKLPFRELVMNYDVDITYTPMMLADVFVNSVFARDSDFTTAHRDAPVVAQFAANKAEDLSAAAELISPFVDAVDLNCGCPQRWAIGERIGAHMMTEPELVRDMVRQTKARVRDLPCSVKIRVHKDLRETVEFVKRAESAGVDFITVHGRTRWQRSSVPVDTEAIKLVRETASVPVIANGGVFSLAEADSLAAETGVIGIMAARGLLENPAMFRGDEVTPWDCVEKFVKLSLGYGSNHFIFHHHLMYMTQHLLSPTEKRTFNALTSTPAVLDYLEEHHRIRGWQ